MRLVVFNLKSCEDDPIFTASVSWVRELSRHFESVEVFSVHLGRVPIVPNVSWNELGGGNLRKRAMALIRITKFLALNMLSNREWIVFHYMNHKTAVFPGMILRIAGIHQVLWYAHASSTPLLKIAERTVNRVVTSKRTAFPVKSSKVIEIGQALTLSISPNSIPNWKSRRRDIVSLGRLVAAKRLEECLEALQGTNERTFKLINIGPQPDPNYRELLEQIEVDGEKLFIPKRELPQLIAVQELSQYKYYFSGTREAIDKAAIEAASVGCLILTTNSNLQEILNLRDLFLKRGIDKEISKQVRWYESLKQREAEEYSKALARHAKDNLSLEKIMNHLLKALLE